MSLSTINKHIHKNITNAVTLVKGDGYHYFVFDMGSTAYETQSVMLPYTKDMSNKEWIARAQKFSDYWFTTLTAQRKIV